MRLLSVPGRKAGKLRTTPMSPLTVDGWRYVIAGTGEQSEWVRRSERAADALSLPAAAPGAREAHRAADQQQARG
jgi:hypothetical protein